MAGADLAYDLYADRRGSITNVVDTASGVVVSHAEYDSFGSRNSSGTPLRYGYTGREHDAESGLIHLRARAYDPALGQFLQRDPIGFAAGDMNLYAYTWNDPYNWSDPSGLFAAAEMGVNRAGRRAMTMGVVGTVGGGILDLVSSIMGLLTLKSILHPIQVQSVQHGDDTGDQAGADAAGSDSGAGASEDGGDPGCEPGDADCDAEGDRPGRVSVNQINRQIRTGKAPRSVERGDTGKIFGEKDHIHFRDGNALNSDGTWKHGGRALTNAEKKWLSRIGWGLPG